MMLSLEDLFVDEVADELFTACTSAVDGGGHPAEVASLSWSAWGLDDPTLVASVALDVVIARALTLAHLEELLELEADQYDGVTYPEVYDIDVYEVLA